MFTRIFLYCDQGDWKHDKRDGKGKTTWHDGAWYDGEWRKGKRHGFGVKVDTKGDKYEVGDST